MSKVNSNGIKGSRVSGQFPAFSQVAAAEGVVIAVRHVDDERNISKTFVEYDVRDLRSGTTYHNCRRLQLVGGLDDGDDNTLRPAQKALGNRSGAEFDPKRSPLMTSDGDRVALLFLYGSMHNPVVIGALPHSHTLYGGSRKQGSRRYMLHKGTSVEVQSDGTYVVTRHTVPAAPGSPQTAENTSTITMRPNGDIELEHVSGARLHMLADGTTRVDGADSEGVRLGFNAVEPAVLGNIMKAAYDAFVAAFNSHLHLDGTGAPTSGPITGAVPNPAFNPANPPNSATNPLFISTGPSSATVFPDDGLSEKVVVE